MSGDTFPDVWCSPWFSSGQRGEVVKSELSASRQLQMVDLCLVRVGAIAAAPLAVQLPQISHPTAWGSLAVGRCECCHSSPSPGTCGFFSSSATSSRSWQPRVSPQLTAGAPHPSDSTCIDHAFYTVARKNSEWRDGRQGVIVCAIVCVCWLGCEDVSAASRSRCCLQQGPACICPPTLGHKRKSGFDVLVHLLSLVRCSWTRPTNCFR